MKTAAKVVIGVVLLSTLGFVIYKATAVKASEGGYIAKFKVGDIIQMNGEPVPGAPAFSLQQITVYTPGPAPLYGTYTLLVLTGWAEGQTVTMNVVTTDLNFHKVS